MYVKYIYLYKYFFPVESALDVLRYTMRGGAKHHEIECAIQNVLVYNSTFRLSTSASLLLFLRLLLSQPFENNKCTPIFKLRRKRLKRGDVLFYKSLITMIIGRGRCLFWKSTVWNILMKTAGYFMRDRGIYVVYMYSMYIYIYIDIDIYIYIHVCVFIYIYIRVHIYVYIRILMYIHMYLYIYTHIDMYIYIYLHVCTRICIYIYMYMYTCTCIYMHICSNICIYIYIYIYMYIYVYIYIGSVSGGGWDVSPYKWVALVILILGLILILGWFEIQGSGN